MLRELESELMAIDTLSYNERLYVKSKGRHASEEMSEYGEPNKACLNRFAFNVLREMGAVEDGEPAVPASPLKGFEKETMVYHLDPLIELLCD